MRIYLRNYIKILLWIFVLLIFSESNNAQEILDAAGKGDLAKLKELTEKNIELIDEKDEHLNTAIFYAAYRGHIKIVKFLFEKGVNINVKNKYGETPFHYASSGGFNDIIEFFLQKGININVQNNSLYTPLHYAIISGKKETVELLISKNADINLKNLHGNTPLDLAIENKQNEIGSLLREKGAKETSIPDFIISQYYGKIRMISLPYAGKPNVSLSLGDDGVLLIDSGYLRTTEKLKKTVKELNKGKIKCIINTHLHYDHNGGNDITGNEIPKINLSNLEHFVSNGMIDRSNEVLQGKSGKRFETYYTMRFNGEEIRLIPAHGIHTDKDILIHFISSNVIVMGDLLIPESFPSITWKKIEEYLDFLVKVIDVFPENAIFISGHGRNLTGSELNEYREMLSNTVEIIRNNMEEGKSIQNMKNERILKKYESFDHFIPELDTNFWIDIVCQFYRDKI